MNVISENWKKLYSDKKYQEAIPLLEKEALYNPENYEIIYFLATCYKRIGNYPKALQYYESVLQKHPFHLNSLREVGSVANFMGFYNKARHYLSNLYKIEPGAGLKVTLATLLPHIMESVPEIKKSREQLGRNIDEIMKSNLRIDDNIHNRIIHSSFYLAYHGLNDRDMMVKLAGMYEKICPSLGYESANIGRNNGDGKIRVGFFSKYFGENHPVSIHFGNVIKLLAEEGDFEIILICKDSGNTKGELPGGLLSGCEVITVPDDLPRSRRRIEELNLDILIYAEIGMDPFAYFMAFSRLAPVQCMMGGHTDTSGIKNIDYFISSEVIEPEDAENHYSEKLIKLKNLPVYIKKTPVPKNYGNRKSFGLPDNLNLYICPMMLQKIHPDFDKAIEGILLKDDKAMVLLFSGIGEWQKLTMERIKRSLRAELLKRIGFIPHLPMEQFVSLLSCADIILDSFHFGGGTTNFTALSIGAPIVTWPGEFHRGRAAYTMYKIMESGTENRIFFDELVAKDHDNYIDIAVKIAGNRDLQKQIRKKILENNDILFENRDSVTEFAEMIRKLGRGG